MQIDISDLIAAEGASLAVKGDVAVADIREKDIRFLKPVAVEGRIENIGGDLYLALCAAALFQTDCARCLKETQQTLSFEVREVYSKQAPNADEDIRFLTSHVIDLVEPVTEQFLLELPFGFLCREDCKGLCPVCGCDRNETDCVCETESVDPRLAALKDFLKP